jgi:trans-2,3-dihydro-3-hydroxyanthranilate isomerase
MTTDVHIVDVFAEQQFGGNPLGVVVHDDDMPEQDMMPFARELNFSETTYVRRTPEADGSYRVRIFTPTEELPFAGHPTLGSAWVIREHLLDGPVQDVRLELKAGSVPVHFATESDGEVAWLTAPTIELGGVWSAPEVFETLGLRGESPVDGAPVVLASAGMPILIVPVRSLKQLGACDLDSRAFRALAFTHVRQRFADIVVYVVCPEARQVGHALAARMFIAEIPRIEDPATGAAAACLGAYLLEYDLVDPSDLLIEQGYEMGRPSLLHLRASASGDDAGIRVGGKVRPVLSGRLDFLS